MIEFRKARKDDLDNVLKVRMYFLTETKQIKDPELEKKLLTVNKEFLHENLGNDGYIMWLAIDNNSIIGTSSTSFYFLPPNSKRKNGKVAYIGNIFTYPQYRKQGIGAKLFSLVLNESIDYGCKEIILDASDMGRPLYEKFGFIQSENTMRYTID